MIKLVGPRAADYTTKMSGIFERTVVEKKLLVKQFRVLDEMSNVTRIKRIRAVHETMHFVTLAQKEFSKIRAILSGNTGDKRNLRRHMFL
jgi:hypothetical protein